MVPRVTARPHDAHAGHDPLVASDEIQDAGICQRQVVLFQIARTIALMRMRRIVPLGGSDDVACPREGRNDLAGRRARGEAASVVEMEMRGKHDVDVVRLMPASASDQSRSCVRSMAKMSMLF